MQNSLALGFPKKLIVVVVGAITLLFFLSLNLYQRGDDVLLVPKLANDKESPPPPVMRKDYSHPHSSYKRVEFSKSEALNHTSSINTVLILSNIGQQDAYGKSRTIKDFFSTIETLYQHQPKNSFSLSFGFLCNVPSEFNAIVEFFNNTVESMFVNSEIISKVTILTNPDLEANVGFDRASRQRDDVQRFRRRLIAKNRNFLTLSVLQDEEYLLFLDADVIEFDKPTSMLSTFIDSKKDIIVPRVERGHNKDYDKNSWKGERTKPNAAQLALMDENKYEEAAYVPRDVPENMFHFSTFMDDDKYKSHRGVYDYNIELDSVGGAVLFSKSLVFKLGAIFPTSYLIGTSWDRPEGYDGIETEGLCYLAKPLGFKCWGYPNIVAHHADDF